MVVAVRGGREEKGSSCVVGISLQEEMRTLVCSVKTVWEVKCQAFLGHQKGVTSVTKVGHIPHNPEALGEQRGVDGGGLMVEFGAVNLDPMNKNLECFLQNNQIDF